MRTLKKTLALVLILCMVLSCGVLANASYTDDAEINYTEAVEVLSALGIVTGYEDGSFNPAGTLNRAEACVMIARMLGDDDVQGTAPFTDMAGYGWAEDAIAYCAKAGIVEGNGDGTFNPGGKLTGSAWLKMLAVALGYDAAENGMTGTTWEIGVAKLNKTLGLTAGNAGVDQSAACSREEAALYALNALRRSETSATYVVTVATTTGEGEDAVTTYTDYNFDNMNDAAVFAALTKGELSTVPSTDNLLYDVFGVEYTKLTYVAGRPCADYQGAILGYYGLQFYLEEVATITAASTQGEVFAAIGASGKTADIKVCDVSAENDDTSVTVTKNSTAGAAWTGNGVVINVYNVGTAASPSYYAVKVAPSFGTVTVSSKAATKLVGAYTKYEIGGVSGKVFSSTVTSADYDTAVVTGSVANGDSVLYYVDNGVLYITAVDTITGVVTSKTAAGVMTIDGEKYVTAACGTAASVSKLAQTLYVDEYGYILGAKAAANEADVYVMVLGTDEYNTLVNGKIVKVCSATVVDTEGVVTTIETVSDTSADATYVTYSGTSHIAKIVEGANGYVLTDSKITANVDTLNAKSNKISDEMYANSKTLIVYADYNAKGKLTGTVTTVTGISKVETVAAMSGYTAYALDLSAKADKIADVIFVYSNTTPDAVADTYVYVVSENYTATLAGYTYDVIVAGEETTITVSQPVLKAKVLYSSIVDNGTTTTATAAKKTNGSIANNGGLLFIDGEYSDTKISDSTPVYMIDNYDATCVTTTFGDITELSGWIVIVDDGNGNILSVYYAYETK